MKTTSFNNPRIEKDYALLKLISDQVISIQPLISKVVYLQTIAEFGNEIIDSEGNLSLEGEIRVLNGVRLEIAKYVDGLKQVILEHINSTDHMISTITNFNTYQEEIDFEFEQSIAQLKEQL